MMDRLKVLWAHPDQSHRVRLLPGAAFTVAIHQLRLKTYRDSIKDVACLMDDCPACMAGQRRRFVQLQAVYNEDDGAIQVIQFLDKHPVDKGWLFWETIPSPCPNPQRAADATKYAPYQESITSIAAGHDGKWRPLNGVELEYHHKPASDSALAQIGELLELETATLEDKIFSTDAILRLSSEQMTAQLVLEEQPFDRPWKTPIEEITVLEKPALDLAQIEQTLRLLYQPGDYFWLRDGGEKKSGTAYRQKIYQFAGSDFTEKHGPALLASNIEKKRALAVSVGTFSENASRLEEASCIGLAAVVVPLSTALHVAGDYPFSFRCPEDLIEAATERLEGHRIKTPNRWIISTNAVFAIWTLEQVIRREHDLWTVKNVTSQLRQLLWQRDVDDAFPLFLPLPGSMSFDPEPRQAAFLDGLYGSPGAAKVKLAELAYALRDQSGLPYPGDQIWRQAPLRKSEEERDLWEAHLFTDVAMTLSPSLKQERDRALSGKTRKGKEAENSYIEHLFRIGIDDTIIKDELRRTVQGKNRKKKDAERIFSRKIPPLNKPNNLVFSYNCKSFSSANEALLEIMNLTPSVTDHKNNNKDNREATTLPQSKGTEQCPDPRYGKETDVIYLVASSKEESFATLKTVSTPSGQGVPIGLPGAE